MTTFYLDLPYWWSPKSVIVPPMLPEWWEIDEAPYAKVLEVQEGS